MFALTSSIPTVTLRGNHAAGESTSYLGFRGSPVEDLAMTRIETTQSTQAMLGRRDLLKLAGGAAGAASLIRASAGIAAAAVPAHQELATALIFGAGTDVDELDPRQTDTQEAYNA